jgi:hypothetical protein
MPFCSSFFFLEMPKKPQKTKPIFASVPAGGWRWRSLKLGAGTGEGEGDGVRGTMRTFKQGAFVIKGEERGRGGASSRRSGHWTLGLITALGEAEEGD